MMKNTFVDTLEDIGVQDMPDELSPDQRARWEASIERDIRHREEGKAPHYLSGDEFWEKVEEAIARHHERVPA